VTSRTHSAAEALQIGVESGPSSAANDHARAERSSAKPHGDTSTAARAVRRLGQRRQDLQHGSARETGARLLGAMASATLMIECP